MEIEFENIYKFPLKAMRLSRSHPEVPRDKKWVLQFLLLHGVYALQYCAMAYNLVLAVKAGDYADACQHGILNVFFWVNTLQYFILVAKQDTIMNIMNMMKDDFKNILPDHEKIIVLEYAKQGSNVCHKWFLIILVGSAMFPIKFISFELYLYIMGDFELQLIYPLIYPSPIEENKMQPLIYSILTILLLYYASYGPCMYMAFVPLGPSFMLHACGQLEIVKKRISELYVNPSGEEVKEKLKEVVKHLQYIYKYVDNLNDIFMVVYELMMKVSTFLIPVILYKFFESIRHGKFSVEFIAFVLSELLVVSLPCYYSNKLMEKGEEVRQAIYCCGWESVYDRDSRTTMKLILLRALRPCSIRTIFRTMCLEALTGVFQQSYTLFNLMNAAWG